MTDIDAQAPLKKYVSLDVYYEAHHAVMSTRGLCTTDPTPDNLRELHKCYVERASLFEKLSPQDQVDVCKTLFPDELGGDQS